MLSRIREERRAGRLRLAEIYKTTYNSFNRFMGSREIPFSGVTRGLVGRYESYLAQESVRRNTSSFYMRTLRSIYNQGVERGLVRQSYPFKHVFTGIAPTSKRALPLSVVKRLKRMDLSGHPDLDFARDMFLFSLYTRGMSFVDMAFLRPDNIEGERMGYIRRKTGKPLSVQWEPCMQAIVDKYPGNESGFLLPIIREKTPDKERLYRQYRTRLFEVNKALRRISDQLKLDRPFTTYSARHSWASIAYHKEVPVSVISEGMGHSTEKMTRIYLSSLDKKVIDDANKLILHGII